MNDSAKEIGAEKEEAEEKTPRRRRYKLYDLININETYLDYFIIGAVLLLLVVILLGVL